MDHLLRALIAAIATSLGFATTQQTANYLAVTCIDDSHYCRMNDLRLAVHANVRRHPEIPLAAHLGLIHVRITFASGILGR